MSEIKQNFEGILVDSPPITSDYFFIFYSGFPPKPLDMTDTSVTIGT